jgi:Zn-dependent protease
MRQYTSWSVMLFRWHGLHVRLHMFFLLFAAFTLFLSSTRGEGVPAWVAPVSLGILLVSVLLHELGHYFTAVHFGGSGRMLVLWPLGGLCPLQPPLDPRHDLAMHVAGPLVNLAVCGIAGIAIATQTGGELTGLFNPLAPKNLIGAAESSVLLTAAKLTFWINWVLVVANLLPAFPFDGGRALRSGLTAMNADIGARRAGFIVSAMAKMAALVLLIVAAFCWADSSNQVVPIWFSLVLLAVFLYFSAKQEEDRSEDAESDDELFGYDFSQGYTSLERTSQVHQEHVSPFRKWLEERRSARQQRQRQIEADEERRVDEILSRLHDKGMESLSAEDRSLLKRVSQRLRHRQGSGE